MGKRRGRGSYDQPGGFWRQEFGGMPLWGLVGALALLVVLGVGTMLAMPASSTADPNRQPKPVPTFSFGTAAEEKPVAVFFGDSYTAGTGASVPAAKWASLVTDAEGWREENYGRGGTGYVSTATEAGCGREFCPAYLGVIDEAAAAGVDPYVVFIAGGQNDTDEWFEASNGRVVRDAITATYTRARDAFPDARLIAVGPSWLGDPARWQDDMDSAVRDAAQSVGAEYISLRDPAVLGDPALELGDGGHVNDLGHRAIADRVLGNLG